MKMFDGVLVLFVQVLRQCFQKGVLDVGPVKTLRQPHQERLVVVAALVAPNHDPDLHDGGEVWLIAVALAEDRVDGQTDRDVVVN